MACLTRVSFILVISLILTLLGCSSTSAATSIRPKESPTKTRRLCFERQGRSAHGRRRPQDPGGREGRVLLRPGQPRIVDSHKRRPLRHRVRRWLISPRFRSRVRYRDDGSGGGQRGCRGIHVQVSGDLSAGESQTDQGHGKGPGHSDRCGG